MHNLDYDLFHTFEHIKLTLETFKLCKYVCKKYLKLKKEQLFVLNFYCLMRLACKSLLLS